MAKYEKASINFIVYTSDVIGNEPEVLITTPEMEEKFLDEWFNNTGREFSSYHRTAYCENGIRVRVTGLRVM